MPWRRVDPTSTPSSIRAKVDLSASLKTGDEREGKAVLVLAEIP